MVRRAGGYQALLSVTAESGEYVGKSLGKTREKPTAVEKNLQNVQERAILYIRLTEQKNQNRIFKPIPSGAYVRGMMRGDDGKEKLWLRKAKALRCCCWWCCC